jgi:hypothetical protein
MLSSTHDLKTPYNPDTTKNPIQETRPDSGSAGGFPQVFASPAPPPRAARPTGGSGVLAKKWGAEENTANNRMELTAVIESLEALKT